MRGRWWKYAAMAAALAVLLVLSVVIPRALFTQEEKQMLADVELSPVSEVRLQGKQPDLIDKLDMIRRTDEGLVEVLTSGAIEVREEDSARVDALTGELITLTEAEILPSHWGDYQYDGGTKAIFADKESFAMTTVYLDYYALDSGGLSMCAVSEPETGKILMLSADGEAMVEEYYRVLYEEEEGLVKKAEEYANYLGLEIVDYHYTMPYAGGEGNAESVDGELYPAEKMETEAMKEKMDDGGFAHGQVDMVLTDGKKQTNYTIALYEGTLNMGVGIL